MKENYKLSRKISGALRKKEYIAKIKSSFLQIFYFIHVIVRKTYKHSIQRYEKVLYYELVM